MSLETQEINRLKTELREIQDAIQEGMKMIGTIVAGPMIKNNVKLYRVQVNGSETILPVLPNIKIKLNLNDEVVLVEGNIVEVLDKELKRKPSTVYYNLSTWDDVIGLDEILDDIRTSIQTLAVDDMLFEEFGVKPVKGILLYGPPGNGKTLIGKAIASEILNDTTISEDQFIFIKGGEMLDKYVGETEHRISQTFKKARDYTRATGKKAIIFIDEADAILGKRGAHSISSTVVPTFLSEMDGLEGNTPFVLLSTNLPNSLDEAVIRDGRIDLKIEIPSPNVNSAEKIFEYYIKRVKCDDCEVIAKKASKLLFKIVPNEKISGAMISNLVNLSAKTAAIRYSLNRKTIKAVIWQDVESCINKLK